MKTKGGSKSTQKQGNKKKSSSLFCKPYFKDKDHKVFLKIFMHDSRRMVQYMVNLFSYC